MSAAENPTGAKSAAWLPGMLRACIAPGLGRDLLALAILFVIASGPALQELFRIWDTQAAYSHSWIVAPAALALLVRNALLPASAFAWLPVLPDLLVRWLGVVLCVLGFSAWAIATAAGLGTVGSTALWLLLGGLFACATGGATYRLALLSWLFIGTTVPFWTVLVPSLQSLTVALTEVLVSTAGIPAVVTGNLVMLPAGTFEVAEGCAGLNYFMGGVVLALALGEVLEATLRGRLLLVVIGAALAIVSNWIRVFALVAIGDATEMRHTFIVDGHLGFGWCVFGAFFLPFMWCAGRLRSGATADSGAASYPGMGAPGRAAVLVTIALLAVAAYGDAAWEGRRVADNPPCPGGSTALDAQPIAWAPIFPGAAVERWCRKGETLIYRNAYAAQQPGAELVGHPSSIAPPGWRTEALPAVDGVSVMLAGPARGGAHSRWVLAYRYTVGGRDAATPAQAKWLQFTTYLRAGRRGVDIAGQRCAADCATVAGALAGQVKSLDQLP